MVYQLCTAIRTSHTILWQLNAPVRNYQCENEPSFYLDGAHQGGYEPWSVLTLPGRWVPASKYRSGRSTMTAARFAFLIPCCIDKARSNSARGIVSINNEEPSLNHTQHFGTGTVCKIDTCIMLQYTCRRLIHNMRLAYSYTA